MFMEYVLFFYMLGIVQVIYIFYEMDKRFKDVPRAKIEGKEDQWELGKLLVSSSKKVRTRLNKKEKVFSFPFLIIGYSYKSKL
ncbi:hypothetical protein [Priestia megaterium]|uniref:hypothetical protein n=1 Tax=Priestia megaterium TaxID=1404 RepID=UPI00203BCB38|nr:hypothetical protein [Priestia megaterium]MCM3099870.1 hypothetical protein [Priestia megaterium]